MHVQMTAARGYRCLAYNVAPGLVAQWVAPQRFNTRAIMLLLPCLFAFTGSLLSFVGLGGSIVTVGG